MSIELTMPALSPTMEMGTLAKWLVKEGDVITSGDVIAEIETDKATMEYEAIDEGTIAKILVPEGTEDVPVGQLIAIIAEEDEDIADVSAAPVAKPAPAKAAAPAPVETVEITEPTAAPVPSVTLSDPDVPAGTAMVTLTLREALRDAMAEEMRHDPEVFVMGEEFD